MEFTGPTSDVLMEANLTVVSIDECSTMYSQPITENQLCTYGEGRDSCQSDSGGTLNWLAIK